MVGLVILVVAETFGGKRFGPCPSWGCSVVIVMTLVRELWESSVERLVCSRKEALVVPVGNTH